MCAIVNTVTLQWYKLSFNNNSLRQVANASRLNMCNSNWSFEIAKKKKKAGSRVVCAWFIFTARLKMYTTGIQGKPPQSLYYPAFQEKDRKDSFCTERGHTVLANLSVTTTKKEAE